MKTKSFQISIIIVNYNVEYFLEQCLNSVFKALKKIDGEVFVVDNNSIDGSVEMIKQYYPAVQLIENKKNVGFSKANNQAIRIAQGEYILLLNPDTVVEEDTFQKCIDFMNQHPEGGGLGVRMIDGKGKFLPESKRGLPTPAVAFYKIFGFSRIFPKSKRFSKYHMGNLDEHEVNEIEILSGAFMFIRKTTIEQVGLLDEDFFMYGEDIDLSYRITQNGYKNYYFPETQIIHYKGESTKKSSINYVFVFYRAMAIFAKKHFSQPRAQTFSFFINLAIYFRAGIALLNRFIKRVILPLVDFLAIFIGLNLLTRIWSLQNIEFPTSILYYAIPGYTIIWLITSLYSGVYDSFIKLKSIFKGTLFGTAIILIIYGMLPREAQFSRLFIFLGAAIVFIYFLVSRLILHFTLGGKFDLKGVKNKNFAIVGAPNEVHRVQQILKNTPHKVDAIYSVSPTDIKSEHDSGVINQLDQIIDIYEIDEVIFCANDNSAETIINWMSKTTSDKVEFKIAQPNSMYLIGSNSIDTSGDLYIMEIDNISTAFSKRNKRTFDFLLALMLILLSPIGIWFFKNKIKYLKNCWAVLMGKKSWVGYSYDENTLSKRLPQIKRGILSPAEGKSQDIDSSLRSKLNLIYARDYSIFKDISILGNNWKKIDQ